MTVYAKVKEDGSIVIREVPFEGATAYEIDNMDEGLITLIQTLRV